MKKPFSVLRVHLDLIGNRLMAEKWCISHKVENQKFIDNHIYIGKQDLDLISEDFKKKIEDSNYPDSMKKKVDKAIKEILNYTKDIKNKNFSEYIYLELLEKFKEVYEKLGEFSAYLSVRGPVPLYEALADKFTKILKEKDKEHAEEYFLTISIPEKESFMTEEKLELLKTENLEEHKKKYEWMNCVMFYGLPYTLEHYKKEKVNNPLEELEKYTKQKKEREIKTKEILTKLNLNKEEEKLLKQIREWSYLRTYIKDILSIAIYNIYPLLEEMAKRKGLALDEIIYLAYPELENPENIIEESIIEERKKGFGALIEGNTIKLYTEDRYLLEEKEKIDLNLKEIKGQVASRGKIQAKARVITDVFKQMSEIQKGEIIVTHMTTTDYTPILDKISGIITDEGGLTCHAAIVSRELGIPAVIGTKIASKVFATGDLLELDAINGKVKKLPKYEPKI